MNTIKFNDSVEFAVDTYNKNTYFNSGIITSNATCAIFTDDISALNNLALDTITSIKIYHDDALIYNLEDINATIENINEYLNGDRISVNINFNFNI